MTDQDLVIELEPDDTQAHIARWRITDDDGWLKERLGRDPGASRVTLKASDDDVEGHGAGTTVAIRAFDDENDTEGHAIAVHFPTREDADAFRRRLLVTGVLAGTIAVGAIGGIGLANMQGQAPADAPTIGAAAGAGMDWTQSERQDAATIGAGSAAGMDWSQVERPGTATGGEQAPDLQSDKGGAVPR
jgi:hypothetical protein